MIRPLLPLASAALLLLLADPAAALQGNTIPGQDVRLGILGSLTHQGRTGSFPNGMNGLSMSTTSCNAGTNDVAWFAAMAAEHPFISFMVVREHNGRFEQISDYSYVKHGFFALSDSQCTPCVNGYPDGTRLGVGCSDTYGAGTNANNYWLGPPDEINPFSGGWKGKCSHFDRGQPAVNPPFDCDNNRSLTSSMANALGPVGHRINVSDADMNVSGATYYYNGQYIVAGEGEAVRANNSAHRRFNPSWTGSTWSMGSVSGQQDGSILKRWSGADVTSNTNGTADGRYFVGVKVTQNGCLYHYEYAVHNMDNARGMEALRIPIASGATVTNMTFRDLDANANNDWFLAMAADEISWTNVAIFDNPLKWNSIFNFSFDCDAAPVTLTDIHLDQDGVSPGASIVDVMSTAPMGVIGTITSYCTAGTSTNGCAAAISSTGTPSGTAGTGFNIVIDNLDGAKQGLIYYGISGPAATPWGSGTSFKCVLSPTQRSPVQNSGGTSGLCDGAFTLDWNAFIASKPNALGNPFVGGEMVWAQGWYRDPPAAKTTNLSNGLEFTVCP